MNRVFFFILQCVCALFFSSQLVRTFGEGVLGFEVLCVVVSGIFFSFFFSSIRCRCVFRNDDEWMRMMLVHRFIRCSVYQSGVY